MRKIILLLSCLLILVCSVIGQSNKGIHLQGIARNDKGIIIPNKQIALRLSIVMDSTQGEIAYQEIVSVTTNVLGLFFTDVGAQETNKIITIGEFENIEWNLMNYYLQLEIDPNNSLQFVTAGFEKINYVPLALFAEKATSITNQLPINLGGTGATSTMGLLKLLNIDKLNNTPDSVKPVSNAVNLSLNERLRKIDTNTLSNRINLKLNVIDTLKLSNRINQKLNCTDTIYLSNRINKLSSTPVTNSYAVYYDTSKQSTTIATATAVKFNFQQVENKISVSNNSAGNATKLLVSENGLYQVNFNLQFIKPDINTDELNVWIRKNNAGYLNSTLNYQIIGGGLKNNISGVYFLNLTAGDYIELFYSIKNSNTNMVGSLSTSVTPSKPATPSAMISIHLLN
jgi:hypothetical protein